MSSVECFSNAIKEIYEARGEEVFANARLFHALLDDIVPTLTNERKIFRSVIDDSLLKELSIAFNSDKSSKQFETIRLKKKIEDNNGLSEKWSSFIAESFAVAAGCNVVLCSENQVRSKTSVEQALSTSDNEHIISKSLENTINKPFEVSEEDYRCYISHLMYGSKDYIFGITGENEVISCGSGGEDYRAEIVNSVRDWKNIVSLHASRSILEYGLMIFGLKSNGSVVISKEKYKDDPRCVAAKWTNIKSISAGSSHVVGVRNDGTVVACGEEQFGRCNVSTWKNVVSAQAYHTSTVGVLKNGDVVYTGDEPSLKAFHNISYMDEEYVIGIRKDGTLAVADSFLNWKENDPTEWLLSLNNIKRIKCTYDAIAVLFMDGTVQCMHRQYGLYKLSEKWKNIIDITTSFNYLVGIDNAGTLFVVDETSEISVNENINNAFFAKFRMNGELIILQKNGRIKNITLGYGYQESWTNTTRSWILFSIENNTISDFKKYRYNDGGCYIGGWYNSKRQGNGVFIDKSGEKISGEFKNNRIYNGQGVVCYKDGKFVGSYVNGVKTGKGKRFWNSGNKYEGEFANNKANGFGTFTWQDGSVWGGEFKDDEPWNGEGTWKYPDGKSKTGKWKNGKKKLF